MKKTTVIIFVSLLSVISLLHITFADNILSHSERRELEAFPKLTWEAFTEGQWIEDFEAYLLDQMPFRDKFRSLKGFVELSIFNKNDVNGYFKLHDHLFNNSDKYNEKMVEHFVDYINKVQNKYFSNSKVFVSIIPDKNYFLNDKYLKLDYESINQIMSQSFEGYINLFDILELDDYYKTDPHWKQEELQGVLNVLSKEMNLELSPLVDYSRENIELFLGAYVAQSGINIDPETLTYLSLPFFNDLIIKDFEDESVKEIYSHNELTTLDPYELFLSGASPLMTIKNSNSKTSDKLVLFRDSFGSSIAPLLVEHYNEIILVDTRYIGYEYLEDYVNFDDYDVLFLYSTLVVNNSVMLK